MIVKYRYESSWLYFDGIWNVKTIEGQKDGCTMVDNLEISYGPNRPVEILEVQGNPVYLLNNEGKTIERIN